LVKDIYGNEYSIEKIFTYQTETNSLIAAAESLLKNGKWMDAKISYAQLVKVYPSNEKVQLGYAATTLAFLIDNNKLQYELKSAWEDFGKEIKPNSNDDIVPGSSNYLDQSRYTRSAIKYANSMMKKTLSGVKVSDIQNVLVNNVIPEIDKVIAAIDAIIRIKPNFTYDITYQMTPDPYDHIRDNKEEDVTIFTIDVPSLYALKAALYVLEGYINFAAAYNFDLRDYADSTQFNSINTKADVMSRFPLLGTLRAAKYLTDSKSEFYSGIIAAQSSFTCSSTSTITMVSNVCTPRASAMFSTVPAATLIPG